MSDRRLRLEALIYGWPEDRIGTVERFLESEETHLFFADGAPPSMVSRTRQEVEAFISKEAGDGEAKGQERQDR